MSNEQTDTERAIKMLEGKRQTAYAWRENYKNDNDLFEVYDMQMSNYDLAISALHAQSEAERKIEKIREYCLSNDNVKGSDDLQVPNQTEINILEILEGEADGCI